MFNLLFMNHNKIKRFIFKNSRIFNNLIYINKREFDLVFLYP